MAYLAATHGLAGTFALSLSAFQSEGAPAVSLNNTLFLIFTVALVLAVLLQTAILLSMAIGARKTQKKALEIVEDLRTRAIPILNSATTILNDTTPKLKVITSNAAEASYTLRYQAEHLSAIVDEVAERARKQAARVDGMVTEGINGVVEVTESVQQGVMIPVRQIQSILTGVRVGLDVLLGRGRPGPAHDEDMFV